MYLSPVMRVFVDAAMNAEGTAYAVGVWGPRGPTIRRCPVWVTSQQLAKLWGVQAGLGCVRSAHCKHMHIVRGGKNANAFFCIFLHIQEPMVFLHILHFFAFFCICFTLSFLLMSQSRDKFVSRGVANDAAADVDDTSAGVERSFSLAGNMDTKYCHGLPNATRRITNMLMFNGDIEGRFNPV